MIPLICKKDRWYFFISKVAISQEGGETIGDWSADHGYYLYYCIGSIENDAKFY